MPITPEDLKKYSAFEDVHERDDDQLKADILEAKIYVENLLKDPFEEQPDPLPDELKLAMLKVSQFFSLVNSDESMTKGYKSEKLGDYSYTLQDGSKLAMPDISGLISAFAKKEERSDGNVFLRIRAL